MTDASNSRGVQVGDGNTQTNLNVDPDAVLPTPESVLMPHGMRNLPFASAVFVGRDLDELGGTEGLVLHGLGGVGKTELAVHLARAGLDRYPLIWWITADSAERVAAGLAELTAWLHPLPSLAAGRSWAIRWLQAHPGWLLVLDNVEELSHIADLLGMLHGAGTVIVTTRRDVGPARWKTLGLRPIHVDVIAREASVSLLQRLTERTDRDGAARLAADLGDLPLALEQAAAYLSQHDHMSFDDYRALLSERFERIAAAPGTGGDISRSIWTVWSLTLSTIEARSELAAGLLGVMAYLAPDDIPDEVLLPPADPLDVAEALHLLASYSLISRHGRSSSLHRLVQAVSRGIAGTEPGGAWEQAVALLRHVAPDDPAYDVTGWDMWRRLLPHVEAVVRLAPDGHENRYVPILMSFAGTFLQSQGATDDAIRLSELAAREARRINGPDHPATLSVLNNLARCYDMNGRSAEAVTILEELLEKARALPDGSPAELLSMSNNLARSYQSIGRLAQAVSLLEETLEKRIALHGQDDNRVFTTRNNLAYAYQQDGRLDQCRRLHEQNLADRLRVLGEDHPSTLNSVNALGDASRALRRYEDAVEYFTRALSGRVRTLGGNHPQTLASRSALARAHFDARDFATAARLRRTNIERRRRTLGHDHPETIGDMLALAQTLDAAGRGIEAAPILEQIVAMPGLDAIIGPRDARIMRNNLAALYLKTRRAAEAVQLMEAVVADAPGHWEPIESLTFAKNLAIAYRTTGRRDESDRLLNMIANEGQRDLGLAHPLVQEALAILHDDRDPAESTAHLIFR
ncbi:tetratricopeptide repeat protein [Actinoplanes sp. NPDC051861]|uniref:tetratricopeptide repeat protein n=1 Tax=Actinoplanes sp. NPDC051861 TaxID=3155170 RepID=UPI0034176F6D